MDVMANGNQGTSDDTKTIVTVLLLIFLYPVGVIVMWFWTNWPKWVKILISLGVILFILVIFGLLASVVLVAINPVGMVHKANDTQRRSDVGEIIIAVNHYVTDHKGQLPPGLSSVGSVPEIIDSTGKGAEFCNALVPAYLSKLPVDPKGGVYVDCNSYDTKYQVLVSPSGQITISAPNAELSAPIAVTK